MAVEQTLRGEPIRRIPDQVYNCKLLFQSSIYIYKGMINVRVKECSVYIRVTPLQLQYSGIMYVISPVR